MIEKTSAYETEKQSYLTRLLTAIKEKALSGVCQYGMGIAPQDAQSFLDYYGVAGRDTKKERRSSEFLTSASSNEEV
jgi:hypothetical protein